MHLQPEFKMLTKNNKSAYRSIQGEYAMPSNIVMQSRTTTVTISHFFIRFACFSFILSFSLHPMPYPMHSFLNVTVIQYNVFTELYTIKLATGS
jgi:hypothetical protein